MPNPYEVIHRETNTREENGIKYEDVQGYDSLGRLVLEATYIKYPDGKEGHFFRSVDEKGYWNGGFYDPISDTYGQQERADSNRLSPVVFLRIDIKNFYYFSISSVYFVCTFDI